jgi:hypothetical protein
LAALLFLAVSLPSGADSVPDVLITFAQPSTVDPPPTTFYNLYEIRTQTDTLLNITGSLLVGGGPLDDERGVEYHWGRAATDTDPFLYALEVYFYSPLTVQVTSTAPSGYTPWHVLHSSSVPAAPGLQRFFVWMDPDSPGGRLPIGNAVDPGFPGINQSFGLMRAEMLSSSPEAAELFRDTLFYARPIRTRDIVPEPGAAALLTGLVVVGLLSARCRRKSAGIPHTAG